MALVTGFLIPQGSLSEGHTIRGMGQWKGGSVLVVPLLQEFSFSKKEIKYRTCHSSYYIGQQLPHLLSIPSGVFQGWRTSGHNKHLHSFASDQGGFSRCRHPGLSPRCSSPCNLASRLPQYSCLTGRGVCCRCSARKETGIVHY